MAVTCLNSHQKAYIIYFYRKESHTKKGMAELFKVSEQTINRVLIEAGLVNPPVHIQDETKKVMQLLKKYNITAQTIADTLRVAHGY